MKIGSKDYASIASGPPHRAHNDTKNMQYEKENHRLYKLNFILTSQTIQISSAKPVEVIHFRFRLFRISLVRVTLNFVIEHNSPISLIFTALHGMQTRYTMRILSVRPSVRPSVKRVDCDETEEQSAQIFFIPYERTFGLVF